jgi:DNA-binding phage protein
MTGGLHGSAADWIATWRAAIAVRGWTHREVDFRAGLGEGYCSKLLCGDREPTATTISRMNNALGIRLRLEVETDALPP